MNKNLLTIYSILVFLTVALIVGTTLEFLNPIADFIVTFALMLIIGVLFIFMLKRARRIQRKVIKRITIGIVCLLALPYSLTAIGIIMMTGGNYYPMWQDISIYTNNNGEKVISEWRETSGSIYDYRNRKIISDFGCFRISYNCDREKLKGIWTEYNIQNHTKNKVEFEKDK